MKQLQTWNIFKNFLALFVLCFVQTIVLSQDTSSSSSSSTKTVTTTTTTENWYAQPWVWVVGGAILILLLVALLRGGSSRSTNEATRTDKVTVTRSTKTDSDV
jgi:protein-S-isoprenylcysteine O-methyltransferase Ste14